MIVSADELCKLPDKLIYYRLHYLIHQTLIGNVYLNSDKYQYVSAHLIIIGFKDKDQLWSCDCIVKETMWNQSEKVDHLAYKYWCVLQGSGIIKTIRNLAKSS